MCLWLVNGRAAPLAGCRVVLLPGRGEADALLVDLLARSLGTDNALPPGSSKMLVSELVTAMADSPPDMAFICALPPGGLNYARYLCKRLRAVVPSARLVLVRPHGELADESAVKRLQGLEVDAVVGSLTAAAAEAHRLLAIEVGAGPRPSSVEDPASALDVSPPLEPAETA